MEVSRPGSHPGKQLKEKNQPNATLDTQASHLKRNFQNTGNAPGISKVEQMLGRMKLPFSKENTAVAELAAEGNPALSKETLQAAAALLKTAEFKEGTAALQIMFQQQLPVSKGVFQALLAARQNPSLTSQLQALLGGLQQSKEILPEQFKALNALLEAAASSPEEPGTPESKPAADFLKANLALLGIDDEAQIAKSSLNAATHSVKQDLLKILSQNFPEPLRELAEQALGKLNAQHILSAESGPIQQVVMQLPVCLPFFQGDVTIKWEGKKHASGKIDADFCRVFFWLQMPHLGNTTIDMQVQKRIVHLTIAAEKNSSQLKDLGKEPALFLKQALEKSGYFFSGINYQLLKLTQQPGEPPNPMVQIMEATRWTEVDIRI